MFVCGGGGGGGFLNLGVYSVFTFGYEIGTKLIIIYNKYLEILEININIVEFYKVNMSRL